MPPTTSYVLIASMDVAAEYDALFNEIYDEHVAHILKVPGVRHVTRMKGQPFSIAIGGSVKLMPEPNPLYTAIYEIDGPEVLASAAWAQECEAGRWPAEMRDLTRNRRHHVYKVS